MPYLRSAALASIVREVDSLRMEAAERPKDMWAQIVEQKCLEILDMLDGKPAWSGDPAGYMTN